jgi:HSP20 family protein
MSSPWRRRFGFGLGDVFDEIERTIREMERFVARMMEEFEARALSPSLESKGEVRGPIVYGVRITIGPDGQPIIEEFGNVKRIGRKAVVEEVVEPLVDVIEEKDKVTVIAEVPGVDKDKIKIKVKDNKLIIRAEDKDRKYYKEIELPAEVKPETAKAKYRNGILEITFEKKKSEKEEEEEGLEIKVE